MMLSRRLLLGLPLVLLVAGCQEPLPPVQELPDISFKHRPAIGLDVAVIDRRQPFVPSGELPHIEHEVPIPPAEVARRWGEDRLRAAGASGSAVYSILDASIVRTDLKTDQGLTGAFKTEQAERFEARLEVRLDAENGNRRGHVNAVVVRTQTLPENLTLDERDVRLIAFVEQLGRDLDERLEAEIVDNLGSFVKQ